MQKFIPVLNENNEPLMPTTPARARKLLKTKQAVKRWFKGVFAIKLIRSAEANKQEIVVGIDTGSKREAFTVKSNAHTFLNIQTEATDYVSEKMVVRKASRHGRRCRNTPYRKCRLYRSRNKSSIPASTKARWQAKLRILNYLDKIYPIKTVIVEDIKAWTKKGAKRWNQSFSPLEVGKNWFYNKIKEVWKLELMAGYETAAERAKLGLNKISNKLSKDFHAHCVDSWTLANTYIGGHTIIDNKEMLYMAPIKFQRRQLHMLQPAKGGVRGRYGGTMSLGLKRGSIVQHIKHGLVYVGGHTKGKVSLHCLKTRKRLCQNAEIADISFLAYNSWCFNS